jgi:tetratricopeptide (TPR) repeat protein
MNGYDWFRRGISKHFAAIVAQFILIAAVPITYFAYPVIYVRLIAEDYWGEFATFAAFTIASLLFTVCFVSSKEKKHDFWYLLLAVGTFVVAMEEISWGQRLVGAQTPEFLSSVNFQNEIGLHNIRAISPDYLTYLVVSLGFVVYGFVIPVAAAAFSRVRALVGRLNVPVPGLHLSPVFLATAYFLYFSPLVNGTEIGELFMGLSLGCLATDIALSRLKPLSHNKHLLRRLSVGFVAILVCWILLFHLLMPSLIASAYRGESIQFLNSIISGQGEHSLEFYLTRGQTIAWTGLGFLFIAALISFPFWARLLAAGSTLPRDPKWANKLSIPIFIVGAVTLGILLTNVAKSRVDFEAKLINLATLRLLEAGHYKQAAALLTYLETTSTGDKRELLIARGLILSRQGREEEADAVFSGALDMELSEHAEISRDPEKHQRIARIYSYMGDSTSARNYWNDARQLYARALVETDSPEMKLKLRLSLADVYQSLGEHNKAIAEYLRASTLASMAQSRNDIEWGITENLSTCRSRDVPLVRWKEVEAMSRKLDATADSLDWCN